MYYIKVIHERDWRNWQTRKTKDLVTGFKVVEVQVFYPAPNQHLISGVLFVYPLVLDFKGAVAKL